MKLFTFVRSIILPPVIIIYTGLLCLIALFCAFVIRHRPLETAVIRLWTKGIIWAVGIKLKVTGLENIPEGGVIYVFNHQSLLDIPVIHAAIPKDFRFGAKIELFKIPIFGATMRALDAVPIPRSSRRDAIQALEEAGKRMENGESFILAPEGTRQFEPRIAEFKSGPFIMAISAKKPIVPVVVKGINKVMPKKAFLIHRDHWTSDVEVKVLKPQDGAEFNFEQRDVLKERVRLAMIEAYDKD